MIKPPLKSRLILFVASVAVVLPLLQANETPFSAGRAALEAGAELPEIAVDGNRFVTPDGETVIFRGVSVPDPADLVRRERWNRAFFEEVRNWGANLVRLPVHPAEWRETGTDEYLAMIDQAVEWCGDLGMYLIIDWHTIGNILTGVYHRDVYLTSKDETFRFWNTIAQRYRGSSVVAFYELYNEPTNRNGQFGPLEWDEYSEFIEDLISMIYAIDENVIPLVTGFDWGYDLSPVREDPIDAPGVAYVTHPYPQKRPEPWEDWWEREWGFVAETYPIVATEFGFMSEDGPGAHVPVIGDVEYGERILAFFAERGISWTAWVFDDDWSPQMFSEGDNYTPTEQGAFFKEKMRQLNTFP
ncbi:MAG: glycoside hydrolase family 5 protein [Verrucomicrobiota bacterium]